MTDSKVTIEHLSSYSDADAAGIGRLMPFLTSRLTGEPMSEDLLTEIINSPHHEQLVARLDGMIVGAATLSILMGPAVGKMGYLEDFIADPDVRLGIGGRIWSEIEKWCTERNIDLSFTSKPERVKAHEFYKSHGAVPRDSTTYRATFKTPNTTPKS